MSIAETIRRLLDSVLGPVVVEICYTYFNDADVWLYGRAYDIMKKQHTYFVGKTSLDLWVIGRPFPKRLHDEVYCDKIVTTTPSVLRHGLDRAIFGIAVEGFNVDALAAPPNQIRFRLRDDGCPP